MISIWVQSGSTPRPRRTHRVRQHSDRTECGLPALIMHPVTTSRITMEYYPPQFCHVCFQYRNRFLNRPKRDWRHQMTELRRSTPITVSPNLLKDLCPKHGLFEGKFCPFCAWVTAIQ